METSPPTQRSTLFTILRWFFFANIALITLVALFYAVENFRGHRAWERYRNDAETRGVSLKFADHIPPAVPDDQNAANVPLVHSWFAERTRGSGDRTLWPDLHERALALIASDRNKNRRWPTDLVAWQQAFSTVESNGPAKAREIRQVVRSADEQTKAAAEVLKALEIYEPALDEFRVAMKRPHMRYPVSYDAETPFSILLPHLASVKRVCGLLGLRASAHLVAGKSDAALDDVRMGLRFVNSLEQDRFLISELVRIACAYIVVQPVWEGMVQHRWTEPQLKTLQEQFEKYDWMPALTGSLNTERAAGITTIDWIKEQDSGKRFSAIGGAEGQEVSFLSDPETAVVSVMPRGWWEMEKVSYARIAEKLIANVERGSKPGAVINIDQFDESLFVRRGPSAIWHHEMIANLLSPAIGKAYLKFCSAQVVTDEAAVACALERARLANGSYPPSLDALTPKFLVRAPIDFVSGAPFRYRADGDGYVLYSVGWNQQDDNGRPGKTMFDEKDGDWVWQVPATGQFE
ncbi:MAG TPA: hypothetical protein VNT99_17835 [Methylomirabilota bacterium]|nr:hypothetical protein [Methylomirabilota bacterium]